jgi:hypothetical protein
MRYDAHANVRRCDEHVEHVMINVRRGLGARGFASASRRCSSIFSQNAGSAAASRPAGRG